MALIAMLHAVVVCALAIRHHRNFGTFAFDFGIYDQAWWLIGQKGTGFSTVRGLPIFGHHSNFILLLLSPFARLGLGSWFLIFVQTTTLALGALPVSWIARQRTNSVWMGVGAGVIYLLYPPTTWMSVAPFHPECLSVTPILFAVWFAARDRWVPYWACLVIALSTREEVGLSVGMLGLVIVVTQPWRATSRTSKTIRTQIMGALTVIAGFGWFALCLWYLIPLSLGGDGAFYVSFFAQYGNSTGEILVNVATHPRQVLTAMTKRDALQFQLDLFGPLGFLPLLGFPLMFMAAPQLGITLLGSESFLRSITGQYPALMVPGLILATIDVVARAKNRWQVSRPIVVRALVGWLCACSAFGAYARTPLPGFVSYPYWKQHPPSNVDAIKEALALIPKDAAVVASPDLVPQLSHRKVVYMFPNPFGRLLYGIPGRPASLPAKPEWIILNTLRIFPDSTAEVGNLRRSSDWVKTFEKDGVLILRARHG